MTSTETPATETEMSNPVLLYPDSASLPGGPTRHNALNSSKITLVIADLLVVSIALVAGTWIHEWTNPTDPTSAAQYMGLVLASLPVWPLVFTQQLLYRARYLSRRIDEINRVVRSVAIGVLVTGGISIILKVQVGRQWIAIVAGLLLTLTIVERLIARSLFDRARRNGTLLRPVVIAGRNAEGQFVREMLESDSSLGYVFHGFIEDLVEREPGESPLALLGNPAKIVRKVNEMGVNSVIIAATAIDVGSSNRLIRSLTEHGIHVELSSTLCDIAAHRLTVRPVGRVPMMYVEPVQRWGWRPRAKRFFDALTAGILLVLATPVILIAGLAVKLTSPGPAFFSQARVGRDGELFAMHKLRTMVMDAEDRLSSVEHLSETTGPLFKIENDPRITPVGRWLRRLSIDELPQLVNVIKGEMSLVGPRPALPREVEGWDKELHNRLRVQPGITGMWQVNGRSDGDHDSKYAQLDLYYVDNWSLVTDLAIVARTIPVVLGRKGQY
ncbi:MAG: sugar transferase [Acidimicrobiales bacterium]|nr:sugar transferase [Acidimicrobiales bacterium]